MRKIKTKYILTFLAPAAILYLYFTIIPAVNALFVSFTDWSGFSAQKTYIGLQNFKSLLQDELFYKALGNSLIIMVGGGIAIFTIGLFFVFVLTRKGFRGKSFFSNLFFFPNLISMSALAVLWMFVFEPNFGLLKNLFTLFGWEKLASIAWMGSRPTAMFAIVALAVWSSLGYYLLLMLSGVEKIPPTYAEAAAVDGANELQIFFKITLPLMRDIIVIAMTLWIINSLKYFELVWSLTYGGPSNETQVMSTFLYVTGFGFRNQVGQSLGKATAIGVLLFLVIMVIVTTFRKLFEKESLEY